jgi:hypothetical protein
MALSFGNEVAGHLAAAYKRMPVGGDVWVKPDDTTSLKMFQVVAAAAQAMEHLGRIQILETHEEQDGGTRLVDAIHIRRLK